MATRAGTVPVQDYTRRWLQCVPETRKSCLSWTAWPSRPDARAIGDNLAGRGIKLQIGGSVYDPTDPMGKMFFNILTTFAEFESDLIRMRTREEMAIARAKSKLKDRKPKLSPVQQKELKRMHESGKYMISELAKVFSMSRPKVYRALARTSP